MSEITEPSIPWFGLAVSRIRVRHGSLFMIGIFAISALLRIAVAGQSGLWPDELFSLAIATGHSLEHPANVANPKLGDFVEPDHAVLAEEFRRYLKHDNPPARPGRVVRAVLLSDTSPPLYYLLLYGWTLMLGTTDVALRSFSIACSLACLPLIMAIGQRVAGRTAAIASCVLFAASPLGIYYSTEARMYALLWLCVLAIAWSSLRLQQHGTSIGMLLFWILASAAGFLTHYFFVFLWVTIIGYLLIKPGKFGRLHFLGCLLLAAALIIPWYIKVPESLDKWRITKDWLKWRPPDFTLVGAIRDIVFQFFSGHERHLWNARRIPKIGALLLFAAGAIGLVWKTRLRTLSREWLLLAMMFAAACAGPLVFDLVQRTYTLGVPRYAIAALPLAYLLAGCALACLNRRTSFVILTLIVLTWSANVLTLYRERLPWLPVRQIAQSASLHSSPSDLILVHSIPSGVLGIARYVNGPAAVASWVGQLGNRRTPESLQQLAAGRKRIVFVKLHEVGEPAPEEDWLRANATILKETHLGSAEMVAFRPRDSETF